MTNRRITKQWVADVASIAEHFYPETFVVIKLIPPGLAWSGIAQRMIDERYTLITDRYCENIRNT